jgi:S-adenosylmethionine:tRNA ribosyltransferase-isomerase
MIAALEPRDVARTARLLRVDPRTWAVRDVGTDRLAEQFRAGDLVVVNDAATLPASFAARTENGVALEVRLAGPLAGGRAWAAVLFGAGDWHTRTEDRPPPPLVAAGATLCLGGRLRARVASISDMSPRLVRLEFAREAWSDLYAAGRPVQYSHLARDLALWDAQTGFGGRPWSVETPSAARPLSWAALAALRARGVAIAPVTHAAGLSSTGDPSIDRALPLPERSEVPQATVDAVEAVRSKGGRVVAIGTSTARALEANALAHGRLVAACGVVTLRIGPEHAPLIVDGILSGMHEAGSSHFDLLRAFAPRTLLSLAWSHAEDQGYLAEEFGDGMLILPY